MSTPAAEGVAAWLERRTDRWREVSGIVDRIARGRQLPASDAIAAIDAYRELARDLSLARRTLPRSSITSFLDGLYRRLHLSVHRQPAGSLREFRQLLCVDIPAAVRELLPHIVWVTALFVASIVAGWLLVHTYPELAALFVSEDVINGVQRGELWTDGMLNVIPSSVASLQILANNIAVSLFALCLGSLFAVGTIYIIGMNGLMIGGLFAFTAQHGLGGRLLEFVMAHGPVELSVICIAGAAGASIGESLARPGERSRAAAFQASVSRAFRLAILLALLLVGAGLLEGYVSGNPGYPFASRVVLGLSYWILMVLALTGRLWRPRVTASP